MKNTISILIFEDQPQIGGGIRMLLNQVNNFLVKGVFRDIRDLDSLVLRHDPDIIIMDIKSPLGLGIECIQRIKISNGSIKVIMITSVDDIESVIESLKAGVDGYLLKTASPAKLLECIDEAYEGGLPLTPSVSRQVIQAISLFRTSSSLESGNLTIREKDVLRLLVNGLSYKMVASDLTISVDTVRSHIKKIYEKMSVNSKSEAVVKAIRYNLV